MSNYQYARVFDSTTAEVAEFKPRGKTRRVDRRDGAVYRYSEDVELAVNVALATGRPLLLRGRSGCGKSSLARNVANKLGRRYYEATVTSRTEKSDFLYTVDLVRRLNDSRGTADLPESLHRYIEPGVLWWAFDPADAKTLGVRTKAEREELGMREHEDPAVMPDGGSAGQAVILIDEIDKANPDVPNDLLVPLGSFQFSVPEIDHRVESADQPFVIMTTNEERSLSTPFLRRCVELTIPSPTAGELVEIGQLHFGEAKTTKALLEKVAQVSGAPEVRTGEPGGGDDDGPSVAEFLDLVRAARQLKITPNKLAQTWDMLTKIIVSEAG